MGGRGGGSPASRQSQGPAATANDQQDREVFVNIVEKTPGQPWRVIGDGPQWLLGQSGILVTRKDGAFVIRNSGTDDVLGRGSTLANAVEDMAIKTKTRVTLVDETRAGKVIGRFGTGQ
jgi:hypothetical protein